ncbi:MAG: flagellar assembly protein FliW [Oscillospiraceae bacterium]|jgi:flagellar assembly factor FliW|nr:flagellar assembly protein FliW [Oscillospiraceae bacterium]
MKINTIRFGEIDIAEEKILTFEKGLPGFNNCFRFTIISSDETDPFLWMQSLEEPDIALAVINPFRLFPDYAPIVNETDLEYLGNPSDEDILALTVAVIPVKYENMTTNLVAPILINLKNNQALQVIMENSQYQIKQPIFERVQQLLAGQDGQEAEGGGKDAGSDA